MFKKKFLKLFRSLVKLILPLFYKLLISLKLNRRVINFLSEKSYFSNKSYDFSFMIKDLLCNNKIISMDIGAQGGFNSDNFFPKKYDVFFENILIEPIESEAQKLQKEKIVINKGLWSSKTSKKLYILKNRLGSSSMFEPIRQILNYIILKKKIMKNIKSRKLLKLSVILFKIYSQKLK